MCPVCRLLATKHVEHAIKSAINVICCIWLAFYFQALVCLLSFIDLYSITMLGVMLYKHLLV